MVSTPKWSWASLNTLNLQLDVHFGTQILRLASVNCEAEILIKSVLNQNTQLLKNGACHHHFVCLWRSSQRPHEERILEDFEIVNNKDSEDFYLEIRQCPLKYELFRRPMLVLPRQVAYINSQKYSLTNQDVHIEECLNKSGSGSGDNQSRLRLRGKLAWTFVTRKRDSLRWQHADFLLKTDPKLGGLLMYNTTSSSMSKVSFFWKNCKKHTKKIVKLRQFCTVQQLTTFISREKF